MNEFRTVTGREAPFSIQAQPDKTFRIVSLGPDSVRHITRAQLKSMLEWIERGGVAELKRLLSEAEK